MNLNGLKVTIMGLGRHGGGVAAARYCALQGAIVTVTDLADAAALTDSIALLADVPIAKFSLGEHRPQDFIEADVIVVNPAVKPGNIFVEMAAREGAAITSETELFLNECSARVVGVTGTVGKSTTAALLASILQNGGKRVWLGGNIGHSLLPDLPAIRKEDFVVLEMSSFQLHWLNEKAAWPCAAIVTNCSPNHLDWHGTWEHYAAAKKRLLTHLPSNGVAVLNTHDAEVSQWRKICGELPIERVPKLRIPSEHNRTNAACAASMAAAMGVDDKSINDALSQFTGLPHRLAFVAEIAGRKFYNDSKSTSPAATIAALKTMDRPTWLLLGGANKETDFGELLKEVVRCTKGTAVFGTAGGSIERSLARIDKSYCSFRDDNLADALTWCWRQSRPGDAILLSPACPSTDQFRDFTHRGEEFERLVRAIAQE